jgi:hypothetical protein
MERWLTPNLPTSRRAADRLCDRVLISHFFSPAVES